MYGSVHKILVFIAYTQKPPVTLSLLAVNFSSIDFLNANSLEADQDRQNVGPDLDPNRLTP